MTKIRYFISPVFLILLASCGSEEKSAETILKADPKVEILNRIKKMEDEMHKSPQINNVVAGQALQVYFEYSKNYPNDSITPDFIFKSGEIATAIQQYPQAYSHYKTVCEKYPKYKLIEESYFLQASVLDNYLNEDEKAKLVYEQLISLYPNSKYVNDAKAAIANLGKSDADLIKEFQKKNGGK